MSHYTVRHVTEYRYSAPVREHVSEARMQPRTNGHQRCLDFSLRVTPRTPVAAYRDFLGNVVHHFDVPEPHARLTITAEATVEVTPAPTPDGDAGDAPGWDALDAATTEGSFWDWLHPSHFVHASDALDVLANEVGASRRDDPWTLVRALSGGVHAAFDYVPQSTGVDSSIDDVLTARRGVCQDYAHVLIALLRPLGVPARYVSGYLFHREDAHDTSAEDASHAWVEVWMPPNASGTWPGGWVGVDPTNDLVVRERHVRTAIGRDYADVPPTRGVFTGTAREEMRVRVQVRRVDAPTDDVLAPGSDGDDALAVDAAWVPTSADAPGHGTQNRQDSQPQ